jgi:outer membrane protein TolC
MRWKRLCRGLALLLASVVGCKQVVYVTEDDLNKFKDLGLPANLANEPCAATQPVTKLSGPPPNIHDPDRPIRYISLAEAMAIALEQGTIGNSSFQIFNLFGSINAQQTGVDNLVSFLRTPNGGVGVSDSIRVLRLDPAIVGANIESSLSKFDAVFTSSASWNNTDRPIASSTDVIQAGNSGANSIIQQDATVSLGVIKPLPQGGVVGITFNTVYQSTNLPARVNPSYRPDVQLSIEQPLLQGFGTEINQLRAAHPGSVITNPGVLNGFQNPSNEGILISRIRFDQQRAEFERNVQFMVLNVELAYWNLYYGYWNLYAQEQGLRFAYEAWKLAKAKLDAGRATIADVGQTRGQYESFRANRLQALNDTLELERQLRSMLGMQGDDGTRLVPSDQPTLAPFQPDWNRAQDEALASKPELAMARQEVKAAQLNLTLQKNSLLPDVRFAATYDINSIGTRLDGADPTQNAFRTLPDNHFNNWSAQVRMNMPIGWRNAHANVRVAQLALARAYETLADNERKTISFLTGQYRKIPVNYELIRVQRAAREAFADQLRVQYDKYIAGTITPDSLLEAQRFWANSLSQEYLAIRDYNNALAAFEFAKGGGLTRNNIVISEGGLPCFAQKRAVEHLRERDDALTLRERPSPVPLDHCGPTNGVIGHPALEGTAPALTDLYKQSPPLKKDLPDLTLPSTGAVKTPMTPAVTAPNTMLPIAPKDLPPSLPTIGTPSTNRPLTTEFGTSRTPPATDGPAVTPAPPGPLGATPQK